MMKFEHFDKIILALNMLSKKTKHLGLSEFLDKSVNEYPYNTTYFRGRHILV